MTPTNLRKDCNTLLEKELRVLNIHRKEYRHTHMFFVFSSNNRECRHMDRDYTRV